VDVVEVGAEDELFLDDRGTVDAVRLDQAQ
jgi:hypothetical protein